jgi:hypothetical protein
MVKKYLLILVLLLASFTIASTPLTQEQLCEITSVEECSQAGYTDMCFYLVEQSEDFSFENDQCYYHGQITNQTQQTTVAQESINELTTLVQQLNERLGSLEKSQTTTIVEINRKIDFYNSKITELEQQINNLDVSQDKIKVEQLSLVTGQAMLQTTLNETKQDVEQTAKHSSYLTYAFIFLVIIVIGITVIFFLNRKKDDDFFVVDNEVKKYITSKLKKGHGYDKIKEELLKAGWSVKEIAQAYEQTVDENYQNYKKKDSSKSEPLKKKSPEDNNKKILMIIGISLLLIIIGYFVIDNTIGQAIYFQDNFEFESMVETGIRKNLNSPLLEGLPSLNTCLEVKNNDMTVSYNIKKQDDQYIIIKLPEPCTELLYYDFSIIFMNYQSFFNAVESKSCQNVKLLNNYYILPSRYVLKGLEKNPVEDYSVFCNHQCLTNTDKQLLGICS